MGSLALTGCSILVVEHDTDVALQLADQLRRSGAKVFAAAKLRDAQHMAEHPALSAVVIGLRIGREDTAGLCRRLAYLGIPFMFHTSFDRAEAQQIWPNAPILSKPSEGRVIMQKLVEMLQQDTNQSFGAVMTDRSQVVQLNELIIGITDVLRRTLGEQVTLSTALATKAWRTRADPSQFQHAIVNMAINGRDAMPKGGMLVVETRNVTIVADDVDLQSEFKSGDYVQLSISDTGTAVPASVADRMFERFSTTKATGRGTGASLVMVYGFVKQSGGHITVDSAVGQGTTFNLHFPRIVGAVAAIRS